MTKELELTIHIDGAARGNPGPAAYGCVFLHDGEPILEDNGYLGQATNNVAEYTALVRALAKAAELNATSILIRSDSELLVKQMNGQYKVKNEKLQPLHRQATELARRFADVRYSHVRREANREADRLCNEALDDAARGKFKASGTTKPPRATAPPAQTKQDASRDGQGQIRVEIEGQVRCGLVGVGGETTGCTVTASGATWELDLSRVPALQEAASAVNGKSARIRGLYKRIMGTEVPERHIVRVEDLRGGFARWVAEFARIRE